MNENVIEKIKKLLRLSRSSNPHEAALALERAMAIAHENRIHIASVNPDAEKENLCHKEREETQRISFEKRLAASICVKHFSVSALWGYCSLIFVGRISDIQIAEYAYDFMLRACKKCLAAR